MFVVELLHYITHNAAVQVAFHLSVQVREEGVRVQQQEMLCVCS